jgi:hypothetical protein
LEAKHVPSAMASSTMDAALKEITQYGSERLSKLSAGQRRTVSSGLEQLADETAKTLRTHTIQALNPRANPRDTITALLEEMKKFIAGVSAHVTEACLDEWDKGIAGYNKDLPIKSKIILQDWMDGLAAEQASKRGRSEKELEKKLERMRASSQADLESRTQQIRVAVQAEQEAIVSRLEAQVVEKDESIAAAVARAVSSEELVASMRETLVERTRVLEDANEKLKQDARIQERNFDMHMKRKAAEVAGLQEQINALTRRKMGVAANADAGSPMPPRSSAWPEPEPEPEPEPQPEPELQPDTPTRSLEAAREVAAVTRKLQNAMDNVARVTKERDMLLTMMSDRKDHNAGIASMMEEISAVKQELFEVKAERDLLLDLLKQQKDNLSGGGGAGGSSSVTDSSPSTADAIAGAEPAVPGADDSTASPTASPIASPTAASTAAAALEGVSEATVLESAVVASIEDAAVEASSSNGGAEGKELVRNIEELVTKDRERRAELEALRVEAAVPAPSAAEQMKLRRDAAMAKRGGIALPFGEGQKPKPKPPQAQAQAQPQPQPQPQLQPSERDWATHMQRAEGTSGRASLLRNKKRPGSAPPSTQQRRSGAAAGSDADSAFAPLQDTSAGLSVSVINLNEEMAASQASQGGVFGGTLGGASAAASDDVQSFLDASASSIGSVTSMLLMGGGEPSEHRLSAGLPPRPSSAGNPRRRSLGSHMQNRRRAPERRSGSGSGGAARRRQPRAGSWRERDILQTGTSGVSSLERRLTRG